MKRRAATHWNNRLEARQDEELAWTGASNNFASTSGQGQSGSCWNVESEFGFPSALINNYDSLQIEVSLEVLVAIQENNSGRSPVTMTLYTCTVNGKICLKSP